MATEDDPQGLPAEGGRAALFHRAEALFHRALQQPADEREAFVAQQAAGDAALRCAATRLLRADTRAEGLVERLALFPLQRPDGALGMTLGPWRLVSRVAEGGMGIVYRAVRADGLFEQEVAVKLLRIEAASDEMKRRFETERRMLARLEHHHIARLLDGGTTEHGTPYLVMELIDGLPIDRFCDQQRLPVEDRLRLLQAVCHAVHFAHRNLVVHRDLKPSNVLVDRHGVAKLLDFGIARLLDQQHSARTQTGGHALTPEYASPEQLKGQTLTTASDVYSLGVVLYRLLTGRPPLRRTDQSPGDWEQRVAMEAPTRPSSMVLRGHDESEAAELAARLHTTPARLHRQLRGDLDRIVLMALRKEPDRRYASADQLAEDIERFLGGRPVRARDDTVWYRAQRFVRRNTLGVAAAALLLLGLCGTLLATWIGQQRAEATAQHARIEAESFRAIGEFLGDTFLSAVALDSERNRLSASISRQAERVRRQYEGAHLQANLLDALGGMAVRLDLLDQAHALLDEARDLRLASFGEHSLEHALSLASLGKLHYAAGDFRAARAALEQALALHRALPDHVHTDVATAANDLATVLRNLGDLERARALHLAALALRRQSAGEHTLPVAESLNNLACVELDAGEPAAAEQHARAALDIRRAILGSHHPLTLQATITLAGAAWRQGDLDRVEPLLRAAVDGYRALRGRGRDGLSHALANLAAVYIQRGKLDQAQPLAHEAVALLRERLGPDHPQVAVALAKVAALADRQGDRERAREAWAEVVRIQRASFPPGHARLAHALISQGALLVRAGELDQAEQALREGLAMLIPQGSPTEDLRARAELSLGICMVRRGEADEGKALLARALAWFEQRYGVDSTEAKVARRHLEQVGQ